MRTSLASVDGGKGSAHICVCSLTYMQQQTSENKQSHHISSWPTLRTPGRGKSSYSVISMCPSKVYSLQKSPGKCKHACTKLCDKDSCRHNVPSLNSPTEEL